MEDGARRLSKSNRSLIRCAGAAAPPREPPRLAQVTIQRIYTSVQKHIKINEIWGFLILGPCWALFSLCGLPYFPFVGWRRRCR